MSEQKVYRVIRGALRMPSNLTKGFVVDAKADFVMQGEIVPEGVLDGPSIRSLLKEGRIELAGVTQDLVEESQRIREANPFQVDPSVLIGKTLEDLKIMVLEIDEDYNIDDLEDERAAVQLLTSGWDPKFRQTVAPVSDRSRPTALALSTLEQKNNEKATKSSTPELSDASRASLEAAKARAAASEAEAESKE